MVLKEQELHQIDEQFLRRLQEQDSEALVGLSIKLTSNLKEALERLNQSPSNSSRPSGSLAPWDKGTIDEEDNESGADEKAVLQSDINNIEEATTDTPEDTSEEENSQSTESKKAKNSRKPGRQAGSQGLGRLQVSLQHAG